jgi:hypothetical protein
MAESWTFRPLRTRRQCEFRTPGQVLGWEPTPRDKEIQGLFLQGHRPAEIAQKLRIQHRIVKQPFRTVFLDTGNHPWAAGKLVLVVKVHGIRKS